VIKIIKIQIKDRLRKKEYEERENNRIGEIMFVLVANLILVIRHSIHILKLNMMGK
jgi:hypothetical protein